MALSSLATLAMCWVYRSQFSEAGVLGEFVIAGTLVGVGGCLVAALEKIGRGGLNRLPLEGRIASNPDVPAAATRWIKEHGDIDTIMRFNPRVGTGIHEVAREIAGLAHLWGKPIFADLNGFLFVVKPGMNPDDVVNAYHESCQPQHQRKS